MSSKTKIPTTKEEATPALVPKLRFPEFRDAEGWNATPLGELGAIVTGKTPSTKEDDLWGGEILFITPTDITEDEKYQHTTQRTVIKTKGTKVLPPGSVVYTCIASIGKMALTVVPSVTNQQINAVVPNGKTAREFIYYSLANLTPWIKSIPATSTLPIINKTQFSGFIIPHPEDKAEQQKIAECLSSVDELMATQARKVDALKTHKKGLMQQLFPREGETHPRLRFPEFQNAGEWKENSLGQLIEIASGQVDPKQPPYCDSPQIGSENIESHSGKLVNVKSAGEKGVISGNYAFDENDILYSKIRPALNKVAAPEFKGICSADIYPIRPADGSLLRSYLFYLLLTQDFLDYAIRNSERGKIPKINRDALVTYKALIPSPDEQQRIATCLSSLDALIAAETQKHEALKTHKKGLMQQLFPSPDEVKA